MTPNQRRSLLCPNCKKLISGDDTQCPYCGMKNPSSPWKRIIGTGLSNGEQLLKILIGVNVAMYILSLLISAGSSNLSANPFFFLSPDNRSLLLLGASGYIPIDRLHRWWSLVSANYLHGSIMHIFFNMIALRQLGPLVLQEYGNYRMFIIYTLSGVFGFFVSYLAGVTFTIGASAAVCGLIGAALFFGKSRGGLYGQAIYKQIGGWAIGIFLFGFLVPAINNWAHGGGMLAGAALGFLLGYQERRREKYGHKIAALCCVVITGLVLLWAVLSSLYLLFIS
ncbi:MAG: rhomboid family intramembrane serine protease [Desulfobulbales bacterium]|nr:rhomboid family intramembrane serine protease [Desulfobulbales bacterium]